MKYINRKEGEWLQQSQALQKDLAGLPWEEHHDENQRLEEFLLPLQNRSEALLPQLEAAARFYFSQCFTDEEQKELPLERWLQKVLSAMPSVFDDLFSLKIDKYGDGCIKLDTQRVGSRLPLRSRAGAGTSQRMLGLHIFCFQQETGHYCIFPPELLDGPSLQGLERLDLDLEIFSDLPGPGRYQYYVLLSEESVEIGEKKLLVRWERLATSLQHALPGLPWDDDPEQNPLLPELVEELAAQSKDLRSEIENKVFQHSETGSLRDILEGRKRIIWWGSFSFHYPPM